MNRSANHPQERARLKPLASRAPESRPINTESQRSTDTGSRNGRSSFLRPSLPSISLPSLPSLSLPSLSLPSLSLPDSRIPKLSVDAITRTISIPAWAAVVLALFLAATPVAGVLLLVRGDSAGLPGELPEIEQHSLPALALEPDVPLLAVTTRTPEVPTSPREQYRLEQGIAPDNYEVRYAAEEVKRLQAELEAIQRNSAHLRSLTRQQSGDLSLAYSSLEATQEQKEGALEDLQQRINGLEEQIRRVDELARDLRRVLGLPESGSGMGGPLSATLAGGDDIDPWLKLRADIVNIEHLAGTLILDLDEANTEIQLRVARVQQTGLPRGSSLYDDLEFFETMPLGWPVEGPITSRFGMRGNPFAGQGEASQEMHTGIDIAARTGTPVRATGGGTIQFAGDFGGYGLLVIIDHGRGVTSWYGHNSRLLVSAGQRISAGHTIAEVGSTGRSTGPHVHYEVRINGVVQDPLPLMQMPR